MRALIMLVTGLLVVVMANHWFNPYVPVCRLPVEYSMGSFDERFGITQTEALAALKEAEAVWENALGRDDIFLYKEDASLRVNFIYDERQRAAEEADRARQDLSVRGDANEVLVELHRQLVTEYETHEIRYQTLRESYEQKLALYNAEVERYNSSGGAPPEEYQKLQTQKIELDREREEINYLGAQMNDLVEQINSIGEKGNEMIQEYNERVNRFNDTYVHDHEYTQGDYRHREINVYTFTSTSELVLVLAHELGHALSIGHVDNPASVMYYLMGEQSDPATLTAEDINAFARACEQNNQLFAPFWSLYNVLVNN